MSESQSTHRLCTKPCGPIRHVLLCMILVVPVSYQVGAQDTPVWHEPRADISFRIEKDDTQALIPSVSLLDVCPDSFMACRMSCAATFRKAVCRSIWADRRICSLAGSVALAWSAIRFRALSTFCGDIRRPVLD